MFSSNVTKGTPPATVRVFHTKEVYFVSALPSDFNSCRVPLISGVAVRIEFTVTDRKFFLMSSDPDARFEITDCEIHCPVAELTDVMALRTQSHLKASSALMNFRRRTVTPFIIPSNSMHYITETLFPPNVLPCRIVLGFVEENRYTGNLKLNPYLFSYSLGTTEKPCAIESVQLKLSGESVDGIDGGDVKLDFLRMFTFNEMANAAVTNSITLDAFKGGFYFSFFDLSCSLSSGTVLTNPVIRSGPLRVEVKFTANIPQNLVCLVYAGKRIYSLL